MHYPTLVLLSYSALLSHCPRLSYCLCHTVLLSPHLTVPSTVLPSPYHTVPLSYCLSVALSYCIFLSAVSLSHCHNVSMSVILSLSYCTTVLLSLSHTVPLSYCLVVILSLCLSVLLHLVYCHYNGLCIIL